MSKEIVKLINRAATSGTPIIQSMEYAYPDKGYTFINDQFMLGKDYLVAPIMEQGQTKREVVLPSGTWLGPDGRAYQGPTTSTFTAKLDDLLYFRKVQINKTKS